MSDEVTFGKAYDRKLLGRLWPFVVPHTGLFVFSLLSYPIASALHLWQPYLVKVAIDEHFVPMKPEGFELVGFLFLLAIGLEFVSRFVQTFLTQKLGQVVTRDLRQKLFSRLLEVDIGYVESNPVGKLMTRVTNDVESIGEMFSTGAVSLLGDIVTLVGIVAMMLALDVELTLASFAAVPVMAGVVLAFRKPARDAFRDVRTLVSRMNGMLNEALSGMSVIQAYQAEGATARDLSEVNALHRDANFRAIRFDAMTYAIAEGIGHLSVAALLVFGLSRLTHSDAELGVFVAFTEYLRRFFGPITELSNKYTVMQSAMASAERCFELLDRDPTIKSPAQPVAIPASFDGPHLSFEKVSFAYKAAEPVLHEFSLDIPRGQTLAIVGPTGSGKSTLVKLLCRFYDPIEGRLRFSGVPVAEAALEDLRHRYAIVLQDPYIFSGTIRDNITLGRPGASEAKVLEAAERTRASAVIARRPGGLDAEVGERGSHLSAGERQLVAFARALIADPEVLVLDEATSSVDPETEGLIQEGLAALLVGRTAIIIAHRLSTIERADRILVLKAGKIVEQGNHQELLAKDGLYRKLFELQFQKASS